MPFRVAILTVSDRGSRGERPEDLSAAAVRETLAAPAGFDHVVVEYAVVPDEREVIAARLRAWADAGRVDLILTTGGTGLAPRDLTPEATGDAIERVVPGLAEAMRAASVAQTPFAILSRGIAGTRGRALIVNLPGSPKGVRETLAVILPVLPHGLELLRGEDSPHR